MLKNKMGISLTTMVITVLIMLLIMGTLVYSAVDSVKMRKLNKLYNDLRQLNDAIEIYYLKNGTFPIDTERSGGDTIVINGYIDAEHLADTRDEVIAKKMEFVLKDDATAASNQNNFVNPNDFDVSSKSATYYFIKVGLLENISLNYPDNEYIVNAQSHTVYNYSGVTINKVAYHSLPLTYKDVNYKENHAVYSINLKNISNVTNKNNKILYVAYNQDVESINLRNYIEFNTQTAGDGLGEPKKVTFNWTIPTGHHNYYTLVSDTGELRRNNGVAFNDNDEDEIIITYENYDGTTSSSTGHNPYTLKLQYSYINIHDKTVGGPDLESINLAARHTESTYVDQNKTTYTKGIVERKGVLGSLGTISVITKSSDNDIATGTFTSSNDNVSISSGTKAGTTTIAYEVQSHGYAKDVVTVNVYDFKIYENITGSTTSLTKLDFSGVGEKLKKSVKLNVTLPTTVNSNSFNMTSNGNSVLWTLATKNDDGTYTNIDSSSIVSLSNSDSSTTFNKDNIYITPLATGTVYLKCVYTIAGEEMGTIVIPLNVAELSADGLQIDSTGKKTLALSSSNQSVVLTYTLPTAITTGATVTYSFSSTNNSFTGTPVASNPNKFTVAYSGTSATNTDVTITATVTKNGVETKYSDEVTISYGT